MKNKIKAKIAAIEQLNKEAQGVTDATLDVNNMAALNKRFDERLIDIISISSSVPFILSKQ